MVKQPGKITPKGKFEIEPLLFDCIQDMKWKYFSETENYFEAIQKNLVHNNLTKHIDKKTFQALLFCKL